MNPYELNRIGQSIRTVKDFPKKGVEFRDISTLIADPEAFDLTIKAIEEKLEYQHFTKIAAAESRGFIFGSVIAYNLGVPLVMVRKAGKLPGETVKQEYSLEYGTDEIEVTKESFDESDHVLIIDDLVATGGTVMAMCDLVEKCGADVAGVACVVDLPDLGGSKEISSSYPFYSVVEYGGL